MGKLIRTVLRGLDSSNGVWLLDQALETKATFIAQILTGDSAVRQAEDIGGQELAYAEVKAIASGNPPSSRSPKPTPHCAACISCRSSTPTRSTWPGAASETSPRISRAWSAAWPP